MLFFLQKDLPNVLTSVIYSVLKKSLYFFYPFFAPFKVGVGVT